MTHTDLKIRFLGGGNMAHSLIGGLLLRGVLVGQLTATDPHEERCDVGAIEFRRLPNALFSDGFESS